MIDFTNKAITTKSDLESEQLLKKAVAQGFGLPKGEKALIANRFFRFIGSPYKQILIPATISHVFHADATRKGGSHVGGVSSDSKG